MDCQIQSQEIAEAINHMKAGRAVGPDGLPMDIYELFLKID